MDVKFTKEFRKQYNKLPGVKEKFNERFAMFLSDRSHPMLHNHKLQGKYKGCKSINITGDIRALYEEKDGGDLLFFALGTHSELYK